MCPACPIRNLVEKVLSSGQGVRAAEVQPTLLVGHDEIKPWLSVSAEPLSLNGKKHVIIAVNSISECKQAEQALKESEQRHKTLYESSRDAIMLCAPPTWNFIAGNPATVALFGCKDEQEFISLTPADVSPRFQPDGRLSSVRAKEMIGEAMRSGSNFFEWKHMKVNGQEFSASVLLTRIEVKNTLMLQATVRDITQQKKAEEQIAVFRKFAESSGQALGMATLDGQITYANPTLCRLLEAKSPEELLGQKFGSYYQKDLQRKLQDEVIPAVMRNGQWTGELALSNKGRITPTFESFFLIRDEAGKPLLLADIMTDISDRKRAEQELLKAKEAAESANQAKSEFLANMSHEIRTPMTAILGYSDLLADTDLTAAERDSHLAIVRRNGEHLLTLINDILDLSKIEAGRFSVECQPVDLLSVIADVASMMRVRADQNGTTLSTRFAKKLPEAILTDEPRLRQMIINLAGNAVKFTENGSVRIAVGFLPNWNNNGPPVEIRVIDTGIGISPDKLPHLFDAFVQVDASTSRKYGGTGLGLAICRHIAILLGGELTVQSIPGAGSVFTVILPTGPLEGVKMLNSPTEAVHKISSQTDTPQQEHLDDLHILLAEDGIDNQNLISYLLRKAGAHVTIADNGILAVQEASEQSFDVILMDMQMPEMDGYRATRTLRKSGYSGPIMALTAHAMSSDRKECLDAGCDDYMTKPIVPDRLIQAVAQLASKELRSLQEPADIETSASVENTLESELADDPELAEIIEQFVDSLPADLRASQQALNNNDFHTLKRIAHQLKGAGGSYGYSALTDAARTLEETAMNEDVEASRLAYASLESLCSRIANRQVGNRHTIEK